MTHPTKAQVEARNRNFLIRRIRADYYLWFQLPQPFSTRGQRLCDQMLAHMGAEPESERREKRHKELMDA